MWAKLVKKTQNNKIFAPFFNTTHQKKSSKSKKIHFPPHIHPPFPTLGAQKKQ